MKAVILAAGEGTRMSPLTHSRPKAMLRIANKPLIEHLLIAARSAGISNFIFVVGYRNDQIRDYFTDGKKWNVQIEYSLQRNPKGTADALVKVSELVDDCFLVMNGDVLTGSADLAKLVGNTSIVMTVKEIENVNGIVPLNRHGQH